MAIGVVAGQTAEVDYQLLSDDAAYPLTGCTVETVAYKLTGSGAQDVSFAGTTEITDSSAGEVRFLPDPNDFNFADKKYKVRFKVTRADGKIEFFPGGEAEEWVVRK
jgi:hypothetical protein